MKEFFCSAVEWPFCCFRMLWINSFNLDRYKRFFVISSRSGRERKREKKCATLLLSSIVFSLCCKIESDNDSLLSFSMLVFFFLTLQLLIKANQNSFPQKYSITLGFFDDAHLFASVVTDIRFFCWSFVRIVCFVSIVRNYSQFFCFEIWLI